MVLEWYGYAAAAVASIGHGSYTAPLKSQAADSVDVHPYVMQSYKVTACFLTSWIVLLFTDEDFVFSPWGIVSGLFWVPGGTLTIFAVRNAGIAISIGVYCSLAVLTSYCWGIFVFNEDVKTFWVSVCAICILMASLCIMAYASSPNVASREKENGFHDDRNISGAHVFEDEVLGNSLSSLKEELLPPDSFLELNGDQIDACEKDKSELNAEMKSPTVHIFGQKFNRRKIGIVCAVFSGISSGSVLVPMHYAGDDADGLIYVISFGIGAMLVLITGWFFLVTLSVMSEKSFIKGIAALPGFHFQTLWLVGSLAGLSWSIGNIGGIIAVDYLGQGVGFSITQSSLIISGLWGIFWFKEIADTKYISLWFFGAFFCLCGIALLSYEHEDEDDR